MRLLISGALLAGLWSVAGCENGAPTSPPSDSSSPPPVAEAVLITPTFAPVKISVRDKFGSCTTTFTPRPVFALPDVKHGSRCGHPGTITELAWQFVGATDEGDRYEFERTFPADESEHTTVRKVVVYNGKELLVFDDEDSTVQMQPVVPEE